MDGYDNIKGYENLYKINKNGSVWSCRYRKEMTPLLTDDGYLCLTLCKEGVRKKCGIARLLGLQYITNDDPEIKTQIDHINRIKTDNRLENIRWVSQSENLANKNRKGCVYEDKRKNGKIYWKGSYSYYENGCKIVKQKTHRDREEVEKWLEKLKQDHP